jgi:hypothetical protein
VGLVVDVLRRVQSQAVQVVLGDPMDGVGDAELTDAVVALAVEVDGLSPVRFVSVAEVRLGEPRQVIAVRAQVVVDDVQHHAEAQGVRAVPGPFRREGAEVHLVDDLAGRGEPGPLRVAPWVEGGIDDLRRPVGPLRLEA